MKYFFESRLEMCVQELCSFLKLVMQPVHFLCLHRVMQNIQDVFQINPWCWNKECIFIYFVECTIFTNNMKEG